MSSNIPTPHSDDNESLHLSSTPTPLGQVPRYGSQWSTMNTPQHHLQGSSYFPAGATASSAPRSTPPPILIRRSSTASKNRFRSTSLSSSHATGRSRENILGEEDEEEEEVSPSEDEDDTGNISSSLTRRGKAPALDQDDLEDGQGTEDGDDDPITIKERQSLINVQHPFGLPIWKPALYKKSRSVTRNADQALHMGPSAQVQRHLSIGNIFWTLVFGWPLGLTCLGISAFLFIVPNGGRRYASLVYGLGWYLVWPFGKYVEGDPGISTPEDSDNEDDEPLDEHEELSSGGSDRNTVRASSPHGNAAEAAASTRGVPFSEQPTITPESYSNAHSQAVSTDGDNVAFERSPLLKRVKSNAYKSYGANIPSPSNSSSDLSNLAKESFWDALLGKICFWLAVITIIAPLMLIVCTICWALVVTIPMAKLNWALIKHLFQHPTSIRFCAAPPAIIMPANDTEAAGESESASASSPPTPAIAVKHPRLAPGQLAPSGSPKSTVLLCVYNACGLQYYKYTVGGVNILFVNLLPIVFLVIFDGLVLLRIVERLDHEHKHVPALLRAVASRGLIFVLSLLSVIPLSYFIGMAVASISAQSSIGMGAVINATFGSIIEIILYGIALTQKKGRLVEGSIVGSLLAGVLLMPGASMCSSALRRKEQRFNAKSAGVTSVMLIMAIIGALAPTLFYQTFGNFQLVCTGCPKGPFNDPYICDRCYYKHPDPTTDPFYQSTVKSMMYFCASILIFSYLIGLWFSLRTHASQIWQNPQPLLQHPELPGQQRLSVYQRLVPSNLGAHPPHRPASLARKASHTATYSAPRTQAGSENTDAPTETSMLLERPISPSNTRRVSYAPTQPQPPYSPVLETVNRTVKDSGQLPQTMSTDDFTRAVAVATVSALRHQQTHVHSAKSRVSAADEAGGHGGHDAPNWSRQTSASVLLGCTALYAIIAEILVDVVDVMVEDLHIPEKFLGITLFALVPNTTEFMNAMSFALNGNIALSMEIGSAYALQVCLLQIPAMVAFSAWYNPKAIGEIADSFTLIFPRWDVISLILSMFLMTYTYIEARSNYHRGSILILSYLVLVSGFYFAPDQSADVDVFSQTSHLISQEFPRLTITQAFWWYTKGLWA